MISTISIITPSYQQGQFIERTIQSVLTQAVPDTSLEYLVFDAYSTDNTIEILKKYDQRLHWISEKDNGQTHAINKGILASKGEIIGWLNSDDIYYPGAIAAVIAFFDKNPDIDILYGMANHIDEEDRIIEPYPVKSWDFELLKDSCFICQPAVFLRRTTIDKYGLLDEKLHFCMDYEYWLRLGVSGAKFAHLPIVFAGSRLHADAKTVNQVLPATKEANDMLKKKLGFVPDTWILYYAEQLVKKVKITQKHRIYFLFGLIFTTVYASLRWNQKIAQTLLSRFCLKLKKTTNLG